MRTLTIAVCCAIALNAVAADAPSTTAVQSTFGAYKAALLDEDGVKAADVVSARTIAYYDGILTHALKTKRPELEKLDFMSRFMIMRVRHEFSHEQITAMNGRQLLAEGVDRGWISKSSVANIDKLVGIRVYGAKAEASLPMAPDTPLFFFVKESGQWKLDLAASFAMGNAAMTHEIGKMGMTEDQFIVRTLGMLSTKKIDEARLYTPLVQ